MNWIIGEFLMSEAFHFWHLLRSTVIGLFFRWHVVEVCIKGYHIICAYPETVKICTFLPLLADILKGTRIKPEMRN